MTNYLNEKIQVNEVTQKLQVKELDMLIKIASIFIEEKIEFFLACGTALGCARHEGFIPWDDDVDIYVHGYDYDKIRAVFANGPIDNLEFQDYTTVKDYPYPFPKIVATDTVLVEDPLKHLSYHCGVYIDIFPLAEVNNNKLIRFVSEKVRYFRYCELKAYYFKFDGAKRFLNTLAHVFVKPNRTQKNLYFQYKTKQYNPLMLVDVGTFGKQALLEAVNFDGIEMMPFEGVRMPMPKGYKNYLTAYYGDYMKLPEEDQRVSRHHIKELVIEGEKVI